MSCGHKSVLSLLNIIHGVFDFVNKLLQLSSEVVGRRVDGRFYG